MRADETKITMMARVLFPFNFLDCTEFIFHGRSLLYDPGPRTRRCEVRPSGSRWYPRSSPGRKCKAAVDRSPSPRTSNLPSSGRNRE